MGFHGLDRISKSPERLTFEDTFSIAAFVCLASNKVLREVLDGSKYDDDALKLQAISLLQILSTREALIGFSPEELAGLIGGVLVMDTVVRISYGESTPIFGLGGMGGDKGFTQKGSKLFSISTLSALSLASFGPVHKHHSYPNTSKVAGQSAIEAFGARSDFRTPEQMSEILRQGNLLMTSCHSTRTIHSLSHLLKGETINHAIGPAAIPQDCDDELIALIGVNQNVHPETFIKALAVLDAHGIQKYGPSVAFCGTDLTKEQLHFSNLDIFSPFKDYRNHVILDEVAPPPYMTLASFLLPGGVKTVILGIDDFMEDLEEFKLSDLLIPNIPANILAANEAVVRAEDQAKAKYVAMSVALALFTKDYALKADAFDEDSRINKQYLRECFRRSLITFTNGSAFKNLERYIKLTNSGYNL